MSYPIHFLLNLLATDVVVPLPLIAICDSCIKVNIEEGTLLYYDNYMPSDEKFIEQEREKSKKIFRRRKNLDDLTT
jgi:hypothetical protein